MAKDQVYDCMDESPDRTAAIETFQHFTSKLVMGRLGFRMTREAKADGSFRLTIEGDGKPVGSRSPDPEVAEAPRPARVKQSKSQDAAGSEAQP